jgi:AAA15 family ATPase/GTPase
MISKLKIQNFRSIKNAELSLGKITVLTGANNSGKSSLIYAILALKNTISNPNQSIDNCLTLPFINLGGFEQTVYLKDQKLNINLGITARENDTEMDYDLSMGKVSSSLNLLAKTPFQFSAKIDIAFPYPANKSEILTIQPYGYPIRLSWNGISSMLNNSDETHNSLSRSMKIAFEKKELKEIKTDLLLSIFRIPIISISKIDFVPLRRGFTKPFFNPVPLQAQISTEDEMATLLAHDRELVGKVAHYLEKIVDRTFSVHSIPGIGSFNLQTRDRKTGFTADLVNEGLGTNQLVTILAKILQKENKFICIDEPEIHLHPTIIDKLVSVLIEIAEQENKQFLVSTHSEHFINSLLTKVAAKEIQHEDVKVYYLHKDKEETKIEDQEVNDKGQIKGGLKNFYATELSNMDTFFKITD